MMHPGELNDRTLPRYERKLSSVTVERTEYLCLWVFFFFISLGFVFVLEDDVKISALQDFISFLALFLNYKNEEILNLIFTKE